MNGDRKHPRQEKNRSQYDKAISSKAKKKKLRTYIYCILINLILSLCHPSCTYEYKKFTIEALVYDHRIVS